MEIFESSNSFILSTYVICNILGVLVYNATSWRMNRYGAELVEWMRKNANKELFKEERTRPHLTLVFYNKFTSISRNWNLRDLAGTQETGPRTREEVRVLR